MVRLEPMTDPEFRELLSALDREYAEDHVRAGTWPKEGSLERAHAETTSLLPQGLQTPDQFLRTVVDERTGQRVGEVWYAVRQDGLLRELWIYWVGVAEGHRRHGFGQAVLVQLEEEARRLGVSHLALHVFGDNQPARELYTRMGYGMTNIRMMKVLAPQK